MQSIQLQEQKEISLGYYTIRAAMDAAEGLQGKQ